MGRSKTPRPSAAAIRYLEELQEAVGPAFCLRGEVERQSGNVFDPGYRLRARRDGVYGADFEKQMADAAEEWRKVADRVPSTKQNVVEYSLLEILCSEIRGEIARRGLQFEREPVFASLPTSDVNAMRVRAPSGEHLVILNSGLFIFLNLMAKAAASFFPAEGSSNGETSTFLADPEVVLPSVSANEGGLQRLSEVLAAQLLFGRPWMAPQYFPSPRWAPLAREMLNSAELFVVGHEYAHALISESEPELQAGEWRTGEVQVDTVTFDWATEYAADAVGLGLMLGVFAGKGYDLSTIFSGPELVYSSADMIYDALGVTTASSHPPTASRRENLRAALRGWLPSGEASEGMVEPAIRHATTLERVLVQAWSEVKPSLAETGEGILRGHLKRSQGRS